MPVSRRPTAHEARMATLPGQRRSQPRFPQLGCAVSLFDEL
ncbi:hypothetical protein [Streptomyces sp. NBC_01518]